MRSGQRAAEAPPDLHRSAYSHLQQDIGHLRRSLLELIHQHHAVRVASNCLREQAGRVGEANVAGSAISEKVSVSVMMCKADRVDSRRSDQTADGVTIVELAATKDASQTRLHILEYGDPHLILIVTKFFSVPVNSTARAFANSVLPTPDGVTVTRQSKAHPPGPCYLPVGPRKRKLAIGRLPE